MSNEVDTLIHDRAAEMVEGLMKSVLPEPNEATSGVSPMPTIETHS
jgi:hypothetical protein